METGAPRPPLVCMAKTNIVLIGMPAAGKSTIGVLLAKRLGLNFIDTDVLIQVRTGMRLQTIIDQQGSSAFRVIEEQTILDLQVENTVIATGGSVVYSEAAMLALGKYGYRVYLDVPLKSLSLRLKDMDSRGLVIAPGETLASLYLGRLPLYRHYADITIDCAKAGMEKILREIITRVSPLRKTCQG